MDLIADLPITAAFDYITHAALQEKEREAFEMWQRLYPFMAAGFIRYQGYREFRGDLLKPKRQHTKKNTQEIEKEMMAVVAAYEGR